MSDRLHEILKSLSDELETGIKTRVDAQIGMAMDTGRVQALQAYMDAFRHVCPRSFQLVISNALSEAEQKIAEAARRLALHREYQTAVGRLIEVRLNG